MTATQQDFHVGYYTSGSGDPLVTFVGPRWPGKDTLFNLQWLTVGYVVLPNIENKEPFPNVYQGDVS